MYKQNSTVCIKAITGGLVLLPRRELGNGQSCKKSRKVKEIVCALQPKTIELNAGVVGKSGYLSGGRANLAHKLSGQVIKRKRAYVRRDIW